MYAVIEDDHSSRRVLSRVVEKISSSEVIDFSCAESFLRESKIQGHSLKAIFLDISLPGMSGIEAIPKIKEINTYSEVPIIMCSALNDKLTILKALKAGAANFLVKPLSKDSIVKIIESLSDKQAKA